MYLRAGQNRYEENKDDDMQQAYLNRLNAASDQIPNPAPRVQNESAENKAIYQEVYGKNSRSDASSTMRIKWAFESTKEMRNNGQMNMIS